MEPMADMTLKNVTPNSKIMMLQLHITETSQKTEGSKLMSDLAELQKSNLDLQRRHAQFQHEVRRRDKEFERLQVFIPCA